MHDSLLPGYKEANALGYSLIFHSEDKSCATYGRYGLALTVFSTGQAELSGIHKMARVFIGTFSFPNKNFATFQKTILECLPVTDDDYCDDCQQYHKGPCKDA